ncbi:hypothetical protein [Paenibacillus mendelii]|uniref:Gram-positive cocci surface proteins LPxTG domain-containing protein n=1 Tax=Paenibacillus mendelii TaxID=206163 RepID=A0ABV6J5X5_9BACL|nr:hypothetical protein [Paenibacillus mendelii]MCQ6560012.1 hypothetical protein [Paenibacillus mendelii]
MEHYDGVILASVVKVDQGNPSNLLHLEVIASYKGVVTDPLIVKENSTWGPSLGSSGTGGKYLFFLKESPSGWEIPLCAPSMLEADASAGELAFLSSQEISVKRTAPEDPQPTSWTWIALSIVIVGAIAVLGVRYVKKRQR